MNNEEINITIAELCGWAVRVSPDDENYWWAEHKSGLVIRGGLSESHAKRVCYPDYTDDLNDMHEAEKFLTTSPLEKSKYVMHLREVCGDKEAEMATARQRAEAFLRTIGVWPQYKSIIDDYHLGYCEAFFNERQARIYQRPL